MENIIETRDAADAPQADVGIPAETPTIQADGGQEGTLFPLGGNEAIANEGVPAGTTAPVETEAPVQEQPPVQTEETPPKNDPNRMEYWQSQTDQAKNEQYKLAQELEYYKNTVGPIAKVIEQNPQVLDNIDSLANGNPQTQQQQGVGQRNSLEAPVKPEKPHSYNEVDAYNDAESDSFKYRLAHDKWRDDMISHMQNVDKARAEHQQKIAMQQQQQQMMSGAYNYAMNQGGLDANKANDFVRWAQNPNNITIDGLIKLYQMQNAPVSQQQSQANIKAEQMRTQQERLKVPTPTAVQTGQTPPPQSDEQLFSQSLLNNGKR